MKFTFIQEHLSDYPADVACQVLAVSRSGYYAWRERPASRRQERREELVVKIRAAHLDSRKVYGSPRVYEVLAAQGTPVSENTVAKIMKKHGLQGRQKRKFVPRTTDSAHDRPIAPNVLGRQFTAQTPNRKWATDITYIPTDEGWLYLAAVIDPPASVVLIEFDGGGRAFFDLTDRDPLKVEVDMPVEMTFRKLQHDRGLTNYFWKARPVR